MSYTHIHTYIYVYMERGVEGVGERGVRERGEGERDREIGFYMQSNFCSWYRMAKTYAHVYLLINSLN